MFPFDDVIMRTRKQQWTYVIYGLIVAGNTIVPFKHIIYQYIEKCEASIIVVQDWEFHKHNVPELGRNQADTPELYPNCVDDRRSSDTILVYREQFMLESI